MIHTEEDNKMSDDKNVSDDTLKNVPTGIDAPNGPKKDWKETVFEEDKVSNSDKIDVPTGIDVPGDSGAEPSSGGP